MRPLLSAFTALVIAFALTGCGQSSDPLLDDPPDLAPVIDGVPEDFPADDIPLIDGSASSQGETDENTYVVNIRTDGDAELAHNLALGLLERAGFTPLNTTETSTGHVTTNLESDRWHVMLSSIDSSSDGGGQFSIVSYHVSPTP